MEKVLEKLKEFWGRIVEWWNNFTSKQKTVVIAIGCGVVLAFVGLYALLSNPNYTVLKTCDTTIEAASVVDVLEENNIPYKTSDDGLRITVPKKQLSSANLSLAATGIATTDYSIESALEGGFTVTEKDKQKKYVLYMEDKLETDLLEMFTAIRHATVNLYLAENDGTLLSAKEESTVSVVLEIEGDFTTENATFVAKAVAGALGMKNTDHVVIMDTAANMLFSGGDDNTAAGNASTQLGVKADAENLMNNKIKNVLQGTGQFGDIKVASNLDMDFSTTEHTKHDYTPAEGQSQGLLGEESSYTSDSQGGTSGPPGTDSNTETTYQYQDNSYSTATIEEYYKKYLPNEDVVYTQIPAGVIRYANSSVAVSSIDYIVVKEEDVEAQGLLEGITWDEYKLAHTEKRQLEVNEDMISLVSNASGISTDYITLVAFEEDVFMDKAKANIDAADVVQIVLIVLILALLAIVVIRSMRTEKEPEEPEELSVETLLQSNPEPTLENIELEQISETRKMIEKFVDENPEAVANLLRNWLNEEWG